MKNPFFYFALLLLTTFLSSCFEISEEIYMRKNGSGRYIAQFNFSQNKKLIQTLILSGLQFGKKNPFGTETNPLDLIEETLKEGIQQLSNSQKGIHHVAPRIDRQNLIYGLEFEFENVQALNEYLSRSISVEGAPQYEWRKKTITRPHYFYFDAIVEKLQPWLTSDKELTQYKQLIYENLQYRCIIRTERRIKNYFPQQFYTLNAENREIVLFQPVKDIKEGKVKLGVTVQTK
ncbi:MAG: hypothetical protein NZM38_05920 [Cytophagales bacterium]|nr:hypothetical protein [Cytophagales bacterium]MDW8384292.1 hypothetical protein [Flammeovirgaceae bacterium]